MIFSQNKFIITGNQKIMQRSAHVSSADVLVHFCRCNAQLNSLQSQNVGTVPLLKTVSNQCHSSFCRQVVNSVVCPVVLQLLDMSSLLLVLYAFDSNQKLFICLSVYQNVSSRGIFSPAILAIVSRYLELL